MKNLPNTQTEKLHTSASEIINSSSNSKSTELVEKIEIPNSPFLVIVTEEGAAGVMGNYRLTEIYPTKEEAIKAVKKIDWNNIVKVISCILHREMTSPFINQIP